MSLHDLEFNIPQLLVAAVCISLLLTVGFAAATSTAAFGSYNPGWDGGRELRLLATDTGMSAEVTQNTATYDRVEPESTVAFILSPTEQYAARDSARARAFVRNGGTLIVADDFGTAANPLLADLGATTRINGVVLRDERHHYRSPAFPLATNLTRHPLTESVDQLTLNYGTYLEVEQNTTVLATTSPYAYADRNRNSQLDDNESLSQYPVAAVEQIGAGQVVVVSDPSLFINRMLDRSGNRAFTKALLSTGDTLLLDYSHAASQPPLVTALLVLRDSPLVQLGVSITLFSLLELWGWGRLPVASWLRHWHTQPSENLPELTQTELTEAIERAHPEWEESRIERVAAVMKASRQSETND